MSERTGPLTTPMRTMLYVAGGLVFMAGVPLLLLTTRTDHWFAWTIQPSLTAAFLGSAYWASCVLEVRAARQSRWARARIAVPAVLVFTVLTLVATLLHLGKFHFGRHAPVTLIATWGWLVVYASVPGLMAALLVLQVGRRDGGGDPRGRALPGWYRLGLGLQGVALIAVGVALFAVPSHTAATWPWALTPLTARAVAAWLIGIGVAGGHAAIENDWERVAPAVSAYAVLAFLELVAVARFPHTIAWRRPVAWVYLAALVVVLATGAFGSWRAHQVRAAADGAALEDATAGVAAGADAAPRADDTTLRPVGPGPPGPDGDRVR